jgi:Zn-dependent protease with chaperone function
MPAAAGPTLVTRWPTELPLFALALVVSLALWVAATVSVIGLAYAAMIGAFFFILHVGFIAHVRGSAVRLGPDQFPELHARVTEIAQRIGLERVPQVYIMQAGGALNAFATRFLGVHFVVLFADLLDACGDNAAARDMIIAHELGHIRAGHLRWHWLLLPSALVPFLGSALSRAREYTCDRYGRVGAGDTDGALLGLAILAAGATHGPRVNRAALVRQRADLNTGWMTLGEWFGSHPPLARRLAQLDPTLAPQTERAIAGPLRATMMVAVVVLSLTFLTWISVSKLPALLEQAGAEAMATQADGEAVDAPGAPFIAPPAEEGVARARADLAQLSALVDAERAAGRPIPWGMDDLYLLWAGAHPNTAEPTDPFDGSRYGYDRSGDDYRIWSSGPDQKPRTGDDVRHDSRSGASR